MSKKNKKCTKLHKIAEDEPIRIFPKKIPKIKKIQLPKFNPIISAKMIKEMKSNLDNFLNEKKSIVQAAVGDSEDYQENDNLNEYQDDRFGVIPNNYQNTIQNTFVTNTQQQPNSSNNGGFTSNTNNICQELSNFNEVFFPALDSLLKQIDVIKDPDLKNGNIQKAYEWYKHNLENFHRINTIDIITKKPYYDYSPDVNLVHFLFFFDIT